MVKPIASRRLPRQTTTSLHEEDLSSNEEVVIQSQPVESAEVVRACVAIDSDWGELADRQEEQVLNSSAMVRSASESASGAGDSIAQCGCSPISRFDAVPPAADRNYPSHRTGPGHGYTIRDNASPMDASMETSFLSQELYMQFLYEEIRVANVRRPRCLNPWEGVSLDRRNCDSLRATDTAHRSLRQVAAIFATSEHRELVRQKADSVNIEVLDFSSFQDLLFGLFQEGGVTSERVVVLFFFCSDLIIRTLRDQLTNSFHHLLDWSQVFFAGVFSVWVDQQGGWVSVLDQSASRLYTAAKIGLVCASIVALCIFIRNHR